jgi:aryl-alcohol dehydrogenase-like predicted oxidoreductase
MQYRRLGNSGLVVSVVGLGGNNFGRRIDLDATRAVVNTAMDEGITLIDTADIYGESEDFLGKLLRGNRDNLVIATKFGSPLHGPDWEARGGRRYVNRAIESSLRRLRTEYIDLYQLHMPDRGTAGRLPMSTGPHARAGCHASSACRTTTACSNATSSPRSRRLVSDSGSASCRTSRSQADS